MKAATYLGPGRVEVRDVPDPECGPGEVVIEVRACAICGTDVRIFHHGQKNVQPPVVIGHEIAGVIHQVGEGVEGHAVGRHVTVVTPVGCGRCGFCRRGKHNLCVDFQAIGYHFPGGFAQYVPINARAVAQGNVLPIDEALPFVEGAIIEPLSCVVNGQEYVDIQLGDTVAVFGAGPIGLMHAQLAGSRGATTVILIDPSDKRIAMARERDAADVYVHAADREPVAAVMEETNGLGADVVIVACGVHQAQQQALEAAARQGRISFFAGLPKDNPSISFDSNLLHYRELSVFGAFASHATQYMTAASLIASRNVDARKLITRTVPLDGLAGALAEAGQGRDLKVVVEPWT